MPRGTDDSRQRPGSEVAHPSIDDSCSHLSTTVYFKRNGTRLHPNVWMEEICIDCDVIIDTKRVSRSFAEGSSRRDKW